MQYLLFDLDNTLYAPERDLFALIDVRINRFMHEVVGIAPAEVDPLRRRYWQAYGVTLQGLIRHHGVDPEDYLHYVHDVDVRERLDPDHRLREVLAALPQRKAVFTNGSRAHAERVLQALDIRRQFEAIFDIRVAGYLPKPYRDPYRAVLDRIGLAAGDCAMIEDASANLRTAKELGMTTLLVGPGEGELPFVDLRIDTIHDIGDAVRRLAEERAA